MSKEVKVEADAKQIILNRLIEKGWVFNANGDKDIADNKIKQNIFFERPPIPIEELGRKRPDILLYDNKINKPIGIVEVKKAGARLESALTAGIEKAESIGVKVVFASNGSRVEARFVPNKKPLVLDGLVVTDFLREDEILSIIGSNTNEVVLSPSKIEYSRPELISCFKFLNNQLRTEGLRAGIDRFSEFANILFLKLLAEKGKSSIWEELKTLDADHLISFLNQAVNEKLAREGLPKDILTPTAIRNPNALKKIIKELDDIQLVDIDTDVKGTAFEYFLKQSSSSENDLGEYFTPRHVVKAVVDFVSPRFTEKIYDPFCGTGGFLIEASKRIKQNTKNLTSEQIKIFCNDTIFGSEITNTARIAKMNLVLHDISCDGIRQVDSLEHPVENEYDVVLTNIPFSQKTTHEQLYFDGVAQHGDSVCILHCLKALKTKGRMAIIVPDGFLFRKDQQGTRAFLIEHSNLEYMVSLPRGTFLPYTATKTHILYFTNAHKPEMRQFFWYFDIKENASTVDSKKEQSKALDVIKTIQEVNFRDLENESPAGLFKKGFKQISLANLQENNYSLRRVFFSDEPLKKEHIFLKEIVQLTKGKPPSKTSRTKTEGCLPYLNLNSLKNNGIVYIPGPDIEGLVVCNKEDILVVADGNVGFVFFGNFGVVASTFFCLRITKPDIIDSFYLFHILKSYSKFLYDNRYGSTVPHLDKELFLSIQIPLISMEDQLKFKKDYKKIQDKVLKSEKRTAVLKNNLDELLKTYTLKE